MSIVNVATSAVDLSSLTESVIGGQMASTTAAGSTALTAVVPMASSADDVAFATAMAAAGGAYLSAVGAHVGERTEYSVGQSTASVSYVLSELISAAQFSF